jgi:hypothetical protein
MKFSYFILFVFVAIACNQASDEVNANLARLNNKSWQYSRIIDSLKVQNFEFLKYEIGEDLSEEQMLSILETKLKTDKNFSEKWIKFQNENNRIDSLENVRAIFLDTINIYVDKYSKLHPGETKYIYETLR